VFKKAFTLLELSVVILIVSVIALSLINSVLRYQTKIVIKMQQEEIFSDLEFARDYAQTSLTSVDVLFDQDSYVFENEAEIIKEVFLKNNFKTNNVKLGFTAKGNTKYGGTVYLFYKNKEVAKLVLAPATGLLRWENL
jgi:prepilin-type N-terminal cleavage/methylation domain-containing protein